MIFILSGIVLMVVSLIVKAQKDQTPVRISFWIGLLTAGFGLVTLIR